MRDATNSHQAPQSVYLLRFSEPTKHTCYAEQCNTPDSHLYCGICCLSPYNICYQNSSLLPQLIALETKEGKKEEEEEEEENDQSGNI